MLRLLRVLPALALVLAVLGACSGAPPPVVGQVPVPAPAPTPQLEPDPTELRIGVDDLGVGFNPHRVADDTPLSRAMAALVLPSAFRPGPDGEPRLDTSVVTSARVTSTEPFTVSYEIAPAASWSDNAPVAAEDFVYLWQQMRSQPGVVGAAGYRAITDVRSRAGGKAVDVVFDRPYPAWQTLFDHMLPAHLLKDAPGSWGGGLTDSIPVSAGPFTVRVVDRIRGQVTLARNDRFWGTPAVPDEVVFQAAEAPSLIDRVRSGDVQATQFRADAEDLAALRAVGSSLSVRTLPEPALVQLALRSDDGPLADVRVRRAVASAMDRSALRSVGTNGGPSAQLPADSFGRAPSEEDYRSTLPADSPAARQDLAETFRLLADAGYTRGADGTWERGGQPLILRLAAPPQVAPYGRLIATLGTQLRAAGIASVVVADGGMSGFAPGRGPATTTTPGSPSPVPAPPPTGTSPSGGALLATTPTPTPGGGTSSTPRSGPTSSSSTTTTTVPPTPNSSSDLAVADIAVESLPIGGDPIADLASVVGCPGGRAPATSGRTGTDPGVALAAADVAPTSPNAPGAPVPNEAAPSSAAGPTSTSPPTSAAPPASTTGAAPTSTDAAGPSTAATTPDADELDELTEDLADPQASEALTPTGFCDPALQSLLDAASAGTVSPDTALALAEPSLWSLLPVIPLFQAASVLVSPTERTDVVVGPLTESPFAGADRWTPPPATQRGDDGIN
ncbi:ABC-type transport system substrate-binding protein [Actinomycetospora succinea]|uniref:ABC-type transport system substrate-binding protein n=1 Tax=Actinomycetospora succinea TaxID=663603 RepID=A0A4R6V9Q5_9PSEU|nr:ABC transporter family substrate-binding protein [Actinomycetospora succinea]TDQ58433.1 ABC-type transport system substrate-binding protein [Actinomycetospora succinea]